MLRDKQQSWHNRLGTVCCTDSHTSILCKKLTLARNCWVSVKLSLQSYLLRNSSKKTHYLIKCSFNLSLINTGFWFPGLSGNPFLEHESQLDNFGLFSTFCVSGVFTFRLQMKKNIFQVIKEQLLRQLKKQNRNALTKIFHCFPPHIFININSFFSPLLAILFCGCQIKC